MLSDLGYSHNRSFLHHLWLITVITCHKKLSVFGCPNAKTSSSNPTACSSVVMLSCSCVDTGLLSGPYSAHLKHSKETQCLRMPKRKNQQFKSHCMFFRGYVVLCRHRPAEWPVFCPHATFTGNSVSSPAQTPEPVVQIPLHVLPWLLCPV